MGHLDRRVAAGHPVMPQYVLFLESWLALTDCHLDDAVGRLTASLHDVDPTRTAGPPTPSGVSLTRG